MNLSKLNRKYKDCLGPSSIAQSLTDNSCYRQLWLQYRFKSEIQDSIFLERYRLQHSSSLNILSTFKYPILTSAKITGILFHRVNLLRKLLFAIFIFLGQFLVEKVDLW